LDGEASDILSVAAEKCPQNFFSGLYPRAEAALSPGPVLVLALDLGGSQFRVALADGEGKFLCRRAAPTCSEEGQEQVLRRIVSLVREVMAEGGSTGVRGMGVAAAGPLDPEKGVIRSSPNLPGWRDVPLKRLLERDLNIPVWVDNDANLAALGEHRCGAGRGVDNLVYLTVSTGIGSGIILGGKLLHGSTGLAAEAGHMTIDIHGPVCKCGNVGCLEVMASGTAIARMAVERIARGEVSAIVEMAGGDLGEVTAVVVEEAARDGDRLAVEVMEEAAASLGVGVVNLLHLFDPQLVIIGGGVARGGEMVLEPVRRVIAERAMPPYRDVPVVASALGDDAGLVGAVALALDSAPKG